jgi:hypothetical protein
MAMTTTHEISTRIQAVEKIKLSICECRTPEQLATTKKMLDLYYKQHAFDPAYLKQEWMMDSQYQDRRMYMIMLDGEEYTPEKSAVEKPSLKRLNEYVKSHTINELQAVKDELQAQLDGIDLKLQDLESYPELYERLMFLREPARYVHRRFDDWQTILGRWFGYMPAKAS